MPKHIPLTQGQFAVVDNEDYEELSEHQWYALKNCYGGYFAVRSIHKPKNTMVIMHRQILNCPDGMMVDHINHDTLDNRVTNLRICTNRQNQQNSRRHRNTSSQYKGVTWHKRDRKWQAQICVNGKRVYLGQYDSDIEAARVYDKAAIAYFREFACPNIFNAGVA